MLGKAFLSGEQPVQRPWGTFEKQQGRQRTRGRARASEGQQSLLPPRADEELRLREFEGLILSHPDRKWRAEARVQIPFLCHPSTGHECPREDGSFCDLAPSAPAGCSCNLETRTSAFPSRSREPPRPWAMSWWPHRFRLSCPPKSLLHLSSRAKVTVTLIPSHMLFSLLLQNMFVSFRNHPHHPGPE